MLLIYALQSTHLNFLFSFKLIFYLQLVSTARAGLSNIPVKYKNIFIKIKNP